MRKIEIENYDLKFTGVLPTRTKTNQIVIHHTGNPTDDDCSTKQIHQPHLAQGWSGIGYHYVIRKDGTIEQAQPIHEQIESTALLLAKLCEDYDLVPDARHIVGHRDLMATACPGKNLYKILQTIRGKSIWYQQN